MATTDARVAPVADERPPAADADEAAAAEGAKSAGAAAAEVGGVGEGEEVRFEGKDRSFTGSEANNGGVVEAEDGGEVEAAVGDGKDASEGAGEEKEEEAAAAKEEEGDRELSVEDVKAALLVQALVAAKSESDNGELGEGDASLPSADALVGDKKPELTDEPEESASLEVKEVGNVALDAELSEEKPEGEKRAEVAAGGEDDGEFDSEKAVTASTTSMEAAEPEDKVAPTAEANGSLGGEAEAPAELVVVGGEEAPEASLENEADVEDKAAKQEPESDASPVVADDGNRADVEDEAAKPEPESDATPVVADNGTVENHANVEDEAAKLDLVNDASPVENHANVEDEAAKPDQVNDASPMANEKDEVAMPEPESDASPEVIDDISSESLVKLAPSSVDVPLTESNEKAQNAEDQVVASGTVENVGVEKPTEVESVVAGGDAVILSRELAPEPVKENNDDVDENEPAAEVVSHKEEAGDDEIVVAAVADDQKTVAAADDEDTGGEENEGAQDVTDREVEAVDDEIVLAAADEKDGSGNEGDEDDDEVSFDRSPARVAIIENAEAAKQIMKELGEGSSSGSPVSGLSSSREYTNSMDGQIVLDDSEDDDDDDDNEDDDEKGFDSAALAALLKAATGASPDGNITVSSQDGSRIFSMDRPAGLGSSAPSLRPTAPRQPARSNLFSPSELAVTAEPNDEMTEEEKKLHDKVELIRVKFLRLVYKLGATPEETVAAQVLYRLSLAEGIRHGRQTNRAFSLENARKKALLLEAEGKEDLSFSCNILVLGKIGVGKSATINSIFGEVKSKTDAFGAATTSVREIVGNVDGVKIRIIDTPGLRPNVMDQGANRKILASVKKYTKRCPPDIVLYVDRLDSLSRDLNDLPLLKTITSVLGSSIWFNAIVALTHAASAPPEGLNGAPMTYEVLMAQRSHIIQQSIRQAAGDMRLMNPVALVENHPSCRKNREGQKVLPNGQSWRHQMLLLCYSSKILSEANSLLKLQDPSPGKLFGFRFRSPPLPFLLSSLLQSRAHPKLSPDQGGNEGDSDIDLDEYSDIEQDEDEEEYDQLPPFKPLTKAQLARLTKEQKNAYFDEYDYRVKLLQKKQWKDELRRLKEMKKRGKSDMDAYGYASIAGENDQDPPPENVSVPLPDMVLPPSFDCDNPTYRYRFLEPTSTVLARPVLDAHGWDHDCGYDGVSVEESLALLNKFPGTVAVQVTKDKKEFSIHLDSSISAKHGEDASSLAGFDIQTVGRQLAYILRGETKFKSIKKNKTTGGFSVTFLGDIVATGLKVEDQLSVGKRLALVASTGAMRAQGDTAYGANLEARLKDKDYPIGQSLSTLGLSLMKWRRDLALGANLQSQFSIGRGSKMAVRLGLNNKLSGQITVRTSTSEQVQIALLGLVPVIASIYRSFRPGEPSFAY
ncbi:translocase of chloroplast 101, chloroplastic isoform X2 [Triticum urartu]|uniref:translocase of chloroplast 101, chloroplastic isoform X2 n=1 Tax=Triticum urartu TaxID=4572 RepID=UPI002042E4D3|nr:translocase of chloroplast 101, chloroplastic isoform X2 [Triticum urartu]